MPKPNLFIVGAPKSGTTYLYEILQKREEFFFPLIKELNYFNEKTKDSYYRPYEVGSLEKYESFFKDAREGQVIVDGSVSYFISSEAPSRIKEYNPKSKVVIITRNPINRAFSHYQMDQRMGHAPKPFSEYLINPSSYHYKQYVENSLYHKQIMNYHRVFGKENVCVLSLENIKNDLNKIGEFLALNISYNDEDNVVVNENKNARNFIGKLVQKNRGFIGRLKLLLPKSLIEKIKPLIYKPAKKESISLNDFEVLESILAEDISLMKRDFPENTKHWKL